MATNLLQPAGTKAEIGPDTEEEKQNGHEENIHTERFNSKKQYCDVFNKIILHDCDPITNNTE